jgi:hypothetical protein
MARSTVRPSSSGPVRITTASSSKQADIAARQKRYLLAMSLRSACFVGAVIAGLAGAPAYVWAVLIAGAIVLPYIAVVLANISTSRSDGFALLDTTLRPELEARATPSTERG